MSFKDMLAGDIHNVFLNPEEFGEKRTVEYDGERYEDIPVVLSGLKEKDRRQLVTDHVQGLYLVSSVLHCALEDLGGKLPKQGDGLEIATREGGKFFQKYYVVASTCHMGMLHVELEAVAQ